MRTLTEYIARQFSGPSGIGGGMISFIMNRQNRPMYDETIRLLEPADKDFILDIGCGNGYVLNMIAQKWNCTFAGIDTSQSAVKAAVRRCRKLVYGGKMTLVCQNVDAMAFADSSFNKAYTVNTVYFWDDLNNTMREIRRVMKPGGVFINTSYTEEMLARYSHTRFGYKRFTAEQLIRAGNDNGFTVRVVPFLNGGAKCYIYTAI